MLFRTLRGVLVWSWWLCIAAVFGCDAPPAECTADGDCPSGEHCSSSQNCVLCTDSSHCAASQFCCDGECLDNVDIESHCGCKAEANDGEIGATCASPDNICLVDAQRATPTNLADATCGCTCNAALGGTLCVLADDAPDVVACGCVRTDPVDTCERPTLDARGLPHHVADTCSPNSVCVCIGEGVIDVCDPNSTLPDCTANGCGNALTATDSCGVLFRECNNPLTGVVDGTCKDGGCSCDELSDCQDTGLNVDSCVILVDGGQCVCDGYEIGGDRAPCPLALECVATGCVYDGAPYATDVLLYAAVGVR